MKLAYYEENRYHTEIMGTFLQFFDEKGWEIYVYNTKDNSATVAYFKKFCQFKQLPHTQFVKDHQDYDKVIVGSSESMNDIASLFHEDTDYNKFIFVCHQPEYIKKQYINVIVLTPLNLILNLNPHIEYVLPIHNYIKYRSDKKDVRFTIIGRFKDSNRDVKDLIKLIHYKRELNFTIYIFSRHMKFVPESLFNLEKVYPKRLRIFLRHSSDIMDHFLRSTKFILPLVSANSWYHKDRLSGNISLAYNYNIPLILDKRLRNIYNIKGCIEYNNSILEVIDQVVDMPDETYNNMVNEFVNSKNEIIVNNKNILNKMIEK